MIKKLAAIFFIIVTVALAFAGSIYYFNSKYGTTINSGDEYFILKDNVSIEEGASALEKRGIIRSQKALIHYAKYYKLQNAFKQGKYILKYKTTAKDLLLKLQSGKSDFAVVTIPEGYSLIKIASTLENNNLIKKEDLINTKYSEFDTQSLLNQNSGAIYDLEGYLFPDTYYIPLTAKKSDIVDLMYGEFLRVFSDEYRSRAKELGLSVNEVISIASLIEKEAANDEERSKISGVIYNRLKKGMPLQIDAAVIYANTLGEKNLNPITKSQLKKDSKYNTYLYKGLPPGPIASPGKPSIKAALYPEEHDYLYYVKGPEGHVFSKTYEEHLKNVKKYLR